MRRGVPTAPVTTAPVTPIESNGIRSPQDETDTVRLNVVWVTAQVLGYMDPNFDVYEFAKAAGVNTQTPRGEQSGHIRYGLRIVDGRYCRPGTDVTSSA
jgi:hypothetical protein